MPALLSNIGAGAGLPETALQADDQGSSPCGSTFSLIWHGKSLDHESNAPEIETVV